MRLTADFELRYFSYLGGYGLDYPSAIRVDSSGAAYVAGSTTSDNIPVTAESYQSSRAFRSSDAFRDPRALATRLEPLFDYRKGTDGFVAVLDATGSRLAYGTYLGWDGADIVTSLAIHPDGSLLVAGMTRSFQFPRTVDSLRVSGFSNLMSGFLVRLTTDGGNLAYASLLSTSDYDHETWADSIAVGGDGQVYVTGRNAGMFYHTSGASKDGIGFAAARFPSFAGPTIELGGLVNAFSGEQGRGAPGTILSIRGANLAQTGVYAAEPPLPLELAGTSVRVGQTPAPIFSASAQELRVQVPYEAVPGSQPVSVRTPAGETLPASFHVAQRAPVLLTSSDASLVAVRENGTMVSQSRPAMPGGLVTVYLVGLGEVSASPASGAAATANPPSPVTGESFGYIDGAKVELEFLGLTPGQVGLGEARFRIPNLERGCHSFSIQVGEFPSNTGTLYVGPRRSAKGSD